jgi:hypothetical protein
LVKIQKECVNGIFNHFLNIVSRYFVVKGNFYSVPTRHIGKEINVCIALKTISAYYKHKIIKTHPRDYGKGQWITDSKDYPESALYYLENTPAICLESAEAIGVAIHKIIQYCIKPGTRVGLRKAQAILRLAEKYSKKRLEAACLRASSYDNYNYNSLSNILSNGLDKIKTNPLSIDKPKNPDESAYCQAPVILVHPSVTQNGPLTLIIFHLFVILHFKFWCKIFTIRFSF